MENLKHKENYKNRKSIEKSWKILPDKRKESTRNSVFVVKLKIKGIGLIVKIDILLIVIFLSGPGQYATTILQKI